MENKHIQLFQSIWTNVCRYILSAVFIFSGFVKIIDPLGSYYKLQDYAEAFGLLWIPNSMLLFFGVLLASIEFAVGLFLFFGVRRNVSTVLSLVLMIFMTPLTLILALTNPISDCGCFGDALVLTNWQTFWKNVILILLAFWLYKFRKLIIPFFTEKTNWIVSLYTVIYVVVLAMYSQRYLPIMDFRPYKVGVDIVSDMSIPEGAEEPEYETVFLMEKGGEQKFFDVEHYPDSTWTFVEAKTNLIKKGYIPPIQNFSILDIETGEDITESFITKVGYKFILVAHRINEADDSNIDLINEVYDYSVDQNYPFICLTSSLESDIEEWSDKTGAEYPFYHADDITLKTIIRSNPGLLLLKDGVIINKWDHYSIPDEYQLTDSLDKLELGKLSKIDNKETLLYVVLWYFGPLFVLFGLDLLNRRRKQK